MRYSEDANKGYVPLGMCAWVAAGRLVLPPQHGGRGRGAEPFLTLPTRLGLAVSKAVSKSGNPMVPLQAPVRGVVGLSVYPGATRLSLVGGCW